jgi:deoxyribodipyrimidine photo-lyase
VSPPGFPASRAEALRRATSINPKVYARTRNALDGKVSQLSPYLTHGLVTTPEVLSIIAKRHSIDWNDKIVFELAWREYFHHVWARLDDGIWAEPHAPPASHYLSVVPDDIRNAQTGVPIIDQQIGLLYATGYLHNHARMWIASYLIHVRKVSWRAGAQWMYGHLLDGDLASNTLSWQWVAGTWTGKPYLFNAENVERYAAGVGARGTVLDTTYEALEAIARSDLPTTTHLALNTSSIKEPARFASPPSLMPLQIDPERLAAAMVVVHPWSLHTAGNGIAVGVINTDFHSKYPWSSQRWQFVMEAMCSRCSVLIAGTTTELSKAFSGKTVYAQATQNPFYRELLTCTSALTEPTPRAFANPAILKRSFSSFWNQVRSEAFPV